MADGRGAHPFGSPEGGDQIRKDTSNPKHLFRSMGVDRARRSCGFTFVATCDRLRRVVEARFGPAFVGRAPLTLAKQSGVRSRNAASAGAGQDNRSSFLRRKDASDPKHLFRSMSVDRAAFSGFFAGVVEASFGPAFVGRVR